MEGGVRYAWCCYMLNIIKQNWAKNAIHIIRELDLVTFHMKDNLSVGTSKSMYVQVRTPCKCCSRSQQSSSPGLRLRLTVLIVLIERVWWISHSLITSSSALFDTWQSTFHTHVVEAAGPRDIFVKQDSQSYFRAVSCNSSSSVFLNHYRTLRTKQRRGSKASGFRKQCHEGSKASSNVTTPLVYTK